MLLVIENLEVSGHRPLERHSVWLVCRATVVPRPDHKGSAPSRPARRGRKVMPLFGRCPVSEGESSEFLEWILGIENDYNTRWVR
jgi:hypothetical protein